MKHIYIICSLNVTFPSLLSAAQQRKPGIMSPTKLAGTNTVLSRSYTASPAPGRPVSATQIARELLHTQGIQGLYKGLGATLMRYDKTPTMPLLYLHMVLKSPFVLTYSTGLWANVIYCMWHLINKISFNVSKHDFHYILKFLSNLYSCIDKSYM